MADPEIAADRNGVEAILKHLKEQGLVDSLRVAGGEPGKESEHDDWWSVTDEGWDLLGLIKSPRYGY